ncbi:MAG: DUF4156 domain-containing protein [Bdellovibrionales bacterium]|nr:DUF4156 domain-containing protein [Bdellovibrionales bacterium]
MKMLITLIMLISVGAVFSGCSSRSVLPDKDEIKVTREEPDKDDKCKALGKITGTSGSVKGTREQALEDLKQTAANKGANYLVVKQYSPQGTSVTGMAYECP